MEIHREELNDVSRYINNKRSHKLEDFLYQYQGYMKAVRKYHEVGPETKILEVGTGIGWFPIQCKLDGLQCQGMEISPQLIAYAKEFGKGYGVDPDIRLGNLEDGQIGENAWDVVITSNIFEHVEHWREGVAIVYRSLKPGGVMFFESTNKFSFTSAEYDGVPLYGWLPNSARYALRKRVHGEDIMKLGIDFHQFRHSTLRKEFAKAGFSKIYDRVDMTEEGWISSEFRRKIVRLSRSNSLVKSLALTFSDATRFICVK
jgi:2-polyprenyl-3-methyl-5-hydroxy-6-metoxy-1,4-benzoquinol methylase